jgi:hypothetical protein
MLRGRCSCAISARPTPSPAFQSLLTPLFPLLTRNSPVSSFVSPTYAKTGGWGGVEILPKPMPFHRRTPQSRAFRIWPLPTSHSSRATSHCLKNSAPNSRLSAVNGKPAFLRPAFTITSIDIVGAPTFPFLHATKGHPKNRPSR